MIYCSDGSDLNQLCDDDGHKPLVVRLLAAHSVSITAVNRLEVLATKGEHLREQLELLLRELVRGRALLAPPINILKLLTLDYGAKSEVFALRILPTLADSRAALQRIRQRLLIG